MSDVVMVLGSKGGVGKTTACLHLAQAKLQAGRKVVCLDTDASTKTLANFKALDVHKIDVMEQLADGTSEVQEWRHSAIYDHIQRLPEEVEIVVDTGASNYQQALAWLLNTDAFETMAALGRQLQLHTVIGGGADFRSCLRCLKELSLNFPGAPLTVWLNPHSGALQSDGKSFEQTNVFEQTRHQLAAVISLPKWAPGTRPVIEHMLASQQTYAEALAGEGLPLWDRPRLRRAWDAVFAAIEQAQCA